MACCSSLFFVFGVIGPALRWKPWHATGLRGFFRLVRYRSVLLMMLQPTVGWVGGGFIALR